MRCNYHDLGQIRFQFSSSWLIRVVLLFALLGQFFVLGTRDVSADVDVFGNVLPLDNPFTTIANEGLPADGNFIDNTRLPNNQVTLEGILDNMNNTDPVDDDNRLPTIAENPDNAETITVGRHGFGSLQISSPSVLNFGHLWIGTTADLNGNQVFGTGVVEITGLGATYNSDYEITDAIVSGLGIPTNSLLRRNETDGPTDGFDLLVGRNGTGTLSISAGARAEIHDSIVAGSNSGSYGEINVDGFSSFLAGGGFMEPEDGDDPHLMVIGRLGTGIMNITNGATVVAETRLAETPTTGTTIGAVVGHDLTLAAGELDDEPGAGGSGTVTVDGSGSLWSIFGGLVLGGFAPGDETPDDFEGNDARYGANTGDGTLYIRNSGLVSISTPTQTGIPTVDLETNMLIGRNGRLVFSEGVTPATPGRLSVGNANLRDENVLLINDGVISGNGRADTGIFRNRLLGEVHVGAGESLIISSESEFSSTVGMLDDPDLETLPLLNWGLVDVREGEITFMRGEDAGGQMGVGSMDPLRFQAFHNRSLMDGDVSNDPSGRTRGEIKSLDGVLRFESGLLNQGLLLFYGGENILHGDVNNLAATMDMMMMTPEFQEGEIFVTGHQTSAVINGDLINDGEFAVSAFEGQVSITESLTGAGILSIFGIDALVAAQSDMMAGGPIMIGPEAEGFTVGGDFTLTDTGSIRLGLGVGETGSEVHDVPIVGAADLSGTIIVDFFSGGTVPLTPMDGDMYTILTAGGGITATLDGMPGSLMFDLPFLGPDLGLIPNVDLLGGTIILEVIDTSVSPIIGGDLNGDGIVDTEDLLIFLANEGNPGGLGDINMDGVVDGLDLVIIQMQFGGAPMPVPGAVSSASVPEPASALLALMAFASLFLCKRQR